VHLLILGGTEDDRAREALRLATSPFAIDAATLPFVPDVRVDRPPSPRTILIQAIECAFPDNQVGSTRLVLTQSTYLVQKWIDALDAGDQIVATADRDRLARCAPEALERRGPWRRFEVVLLAKRGPGDGRQGDCEDSGRQSPVSSPRSPSPPVPSPQLPAPGPVTELLAAAYAARNPAERMGLCRDPAARDPDAAVAQLAQ